MRKFYRGLPYASFLFLFFCFSDHVHRGSVFSNLLELLEMQETNVQRIDDNMTDLENNVSSGLQQLQITAESYSNKALAAKVFGVLMIFMVFFIMFGA